MVQLGISPSFKHAWLNNKNILSIWFYKDSFKFPDKCFGFRLELVKEFTEIAPSTFEPFIGHHQRLFAGVKIVFFYNIAKIT